jgi:hypothetical protein
VYTEGRSEADPDPTFQGHSDADADPTFQFGADPEPAFHFDTDPDPAFQNDADPEHWLRVIGGMRKEIKTLIIKIMKVHANTT